MPIANKSKYSRREVSFHVICPETSPITNIGYVPMWLVCGGLAAASSMVTYNMLSSNNMISQSMIAYEQVDKDLLDNVRLYWNVQERYEIERSDSKYKETMKELRMAVLSFKMLEPNWDGFNALPVAVYNAEAALNLLETLSPEVVKLVDDCYPEVNGTISLKWKNKLDECVSVSVGTTKMSYYVRSHSYNQLECINDVLLTPEEIDHLNDKIRNVILI